MSKEGQVKPMQPDMRALDAARKPEEDENAIETPGSMARLQAFITGKLPPPNEFASYIIEQMRLCRLERDDLRTEINKATRLLQMMEKRLIATEASHDRYIADLKTWDRPLTGTPTPKKGD